jgi:NADPH2 dehydrogenase
MGIPDPKPQFSYLVSQLKGYNLAYLHVTEPRIGGNIDVDAPPQSSNDFLREIWCKEGKNGVFISAGGYTRQAAIETAQEHGGMIAFGRLYIPNVSMFCVHSFSFPMCVDHFLFLRLGRSFHISPLSLPTLQQPDLAARLIYDLPLTKPDRATFYLAGDLTEKGYTDFPAADVQTEWKL